MALPVKRGFDKSKLAITSVAIKDKAIKPALLPRIIKIVFKK